MAGLASACLNRGHHVECMLPFYTCIDEAQIQDLRLDRTFQSFFKRSFVNTQVYLGKVEGTPVVLIRPTDTNLFQVRKVKRKDRLNNIHPELL